MVAAHLETEAFAVVITAVVAQTAVVPLGEAMEVELTAVELKAVVAQAAVVQAVETRAALVATVA